MIALVADGVIDHGRVWGQYAHVVEGDLLGVLAEQLEGPVRRGGHLAERQDAERSVAPGDLTRAETLADIPVEGLGQGLRVANRRRARHRERRLEHAGHLLGGGGREDGHVGNGEAEREVQEPVVARPVVAGDAGAVEDEDDRQVQEPDVEVGLVEGPREEGGVDRDDRLQAAHGHPRGRGDGVLLGDPDVEEPVRELCLEVEESRRTRHRRGEGDDALVAFRRVDERVGERLGERRRSRSPRRSVWAGSL